MRSGVDRDIQKPAEMNEEIITDDFFIAIQAAETARIEKPKGDHHGLQA
jgi:hypothetical protein